MKWTWIKIVTFVAILVFYGSILAHTINLAAADDLPRQMKIGELLLQGHWDLLYKNILSYVEPDHSFFNHHWFSGILFHLFFQVGGWSGMVVLKIALFLTAFSLLFFTALKKADFWLVVAVSLPSLLVIVERTGLRPEVFSYVFVALYLYLLVDLDDHPDRNWVYALIPLQLFWVNMHVFFSIGIMMTAGFLFEKIVAKWKGRVWQHDPLVRKVFAVLCGVTVVSFFNPRGIAGVFYRYPPRFPILISENMSPAAYVSQETPWEDPAMFFFKLCAGILIVVLLIAWKKKERHVFYTLGSIATMILAFNILRALTLFGFLFFLSCTAHANGTFLQAKAWLAKEGPRTFKVVCKAGTALVIGIYLLLIFPGWSRLSAFKQRSIGLVPWAEDSAKFFKENGLTGPIFNDADIGSYLIYELYPQERVFSDNRFGDGYSAEFFDRLLKVLGDEVEWVALSEEHQFNVIYYYHYDGASNSRQFLWRRMHDSAWVLVYADPYAVILVRDTPANAEVVKKFRITPENIEERLQPFSSSPDFGPQAAAADLYNLVGRQDLARKLFLRIVTKWPDRGRIWSVLGQMARDENTETSTVLALMMFEKAIQVGRGTAETYTLLGSIFMRMNEPERAVGALLHAMKIDPARVDTRELLHSITKFQAN